MGPWGRLCKASVCYVCVQIRAGDSSLSSRVDRTSASAQWIAKSLLARPCHRLFSFSHSPLLTDLRGGPWLVLSLLHPDGRSEFQPNA
jgi:hypothetical protein